MPAPLRLLLLLMLGLFGLQSAGYGTAQSTLGQDAAQIAGTTAAGGLFDIAAAMDAAAANAATKAAQAEATTEPSAAETAPATAPAQGARKTRITVREGNGANDDGGMQQQQAMREDRERYREAGIEGFVSKPFSRAELLSVVEKLAPSADANAHVGKEHSTHA